jgi:hypothetical protein
MQTIKREWGERISDRRRERDRERKKEEYRRDIYSNNVFYSNIRAYKKGRLGLSKNRFIEQHFALIQ